MNSELIVTELIVYGRASWLLIVRMWSWLAWMRVETVPLLHLLQLGWMRVEIIAPLHLLQVIAMHALQIVWLYELLGDCHQHFDFPSRKPNWPFQTSVLNPLTQSVKDDSWWDSLRVKAWLVAIRSYCAWCWYLRGIACVWLAWSSSWLSLSLVHEVACAWSWLWLIGLDIGRIKMGACSHCLTGQTVETVRMLSDCADWLHSLFEGLFLLADSRMWIAQWGAVFVVRPWLTVSLWLLDLWSEGFFEAW